MNAKEYAKLQLANKKVDKIKDFYFDESPEYKQYLIDDAIASMKEKLKKYGTSRDPSEFREPPQYSNPSEYKGFVMVICFYDNKYMALASDRHTGSITLESTWFDDKNSAGKQIVKYIDIFRKQTTLKRLNEIKAKNGHKKSKIFLN